MFKQNNMANCKQLHSAIVKNVIVFKPGACLVYRNHFCADVCVCVYVSAP